jgi:hypothetical protein
VGGIIAVGGQPRSNAAPRAGNHGSDLDRRRKRACDDGQNFPASRRPDGLATSPADGPPNQSLTTGFNAIDASGRSLIEFSETLGKKTHYGPVCFRRERQPLITLTFPMSHGVNVVEIDLKPILSQIKVSEHGQANVIDAQGRLIFPGLSLRLDNTNVTQFAQVWAACWASGTGSGPVQRARDILGRELLTVAPLGWLVFVELPTDEVKRWRNDLCAFMVLKKAAADQLVSEHP